MLKPSSSSILWGANLNTRNKMTLPLFQSGFSNEVPANSLYFLTYRICNRASLLNIIRILAKEDWDKVT
jgi:hypothetical protein